MADNLRVLVVEDDAGMALLLDRAITRHGYEVQTCSDGETALSVAPEYRPHVAIVDICLPGIDGFAVAKELQKSQPGILQIAATGRSAPEDILRSRAAGFAYHLIKPLDTREIVELLNGWERTRHRSA
jgi:DNA-binding response OmpR family regulator